MFNKSFIVGVSVTPEVGLEVAAINFATQTVLKYGVRTLEYDANRREVADLDLFKEALQDLFYELQIPTGSEVVLNLPSSVFKINDYPAALNANQVINAIEEELSEHNLFKNNDPAHDEVILPNSSMQFNRVAYAATSKQMLIEMALDIKAMGYKLLAIDTSVNSVINALIYKQRVDTSPDTSWVLLIVDNMSCRILTMMGSNYVDSFEERISIGKVLDDAENYSTVVDTVNPVLNNIPAKYLCVVSKTSIISAEELASRISYSAPIIHQEANSFAHEALLDFDPSVDEKYMPYLSLDIIGAAIYPEMKRIMNVSFNLFNKNLGEIYLDEQPLEINFLGHSIILSNARLITLFIFIAVPIIACTVMFYLYNVSRINSYNSQINDLDGKIRQIQVFLKENNSISADLFDEGDEIKFGLIRNKNIYSYYSIVGREIPKKLWLTSLKLDNNATIEGQADNLESVYSFFRSVKDYNPENGMKLQKLGLASHSKTTTVSNPYEKDVVTEDILTSLNADYYEFAITNDARYNSGSKKQQTKKNKNNDPLASGLELLE